jgi:hypothetical protein
MDATDVLVRHAAGQFDFRDEALCERWVVKQRSQHPDRDRFIQRPVVGLVNDAHPAFADVPENLVAIGKDRAGTTSNPWVAARVSTLSGRSSAMGHCG